MTAFGISRRPPVDDFQISDWVTAIRTAVIQLQEADAWLVKNPCGKSDICKWRRHWKIGGPFLEDRHNSFESELQKMRKEIPLLNNSIEIAKLTDCLAQILKNKYFLDKDRKGREKGELQLVAFSKAALCIAPDKAVVNDSWVRKYFFETKKGGCSNEMVAEMFEEEFLNRERKIKFALREYVKSGSSFPPNRLHSWTDVTLQRRVLDVAIMMAAGRDL
jgi:hypothetical protein